MRDQDKGSNCQQGQGYWHGIIEDSVWSQGTIWVESGAYHLCLRLRVTFMGLGTLEHQPLPLPGAPGCF